MPIYYSIDDLDDLLEKIIEVKKNYTERHCLLEPNLVVISPEMYNLLKLASYNITEGEDIEFEELFGMQVIIDDTTNNLNDIKVYKR